MKLCVCFVAALLALGPSLVAADEVIYSFPLDMDPGWSTEGQWAFGAPAGQGGAYGFPDPTSGYTGDNVYGYNLYGDYPNNMPQTLWLTTTALDFSGYRNVQLHFYRWLGVEDSRYDHAWIEVSDDGEDWSVVWHNPPG